MSYLSNYHEAITQAMRLLAQHKNSLFIGQSVRFPGHIMFNTLEEAKVSMEKRIELPVVEDMQMGISIGLSLAGYLPISIYPRMDFLIIAMNQLVNHLDKFKEMTHNQFSPKVIIRTMVGSKKLLYPGPQHCQNYYEALTKMVSNIIIYYLDSTDIVLSSYQQALNSPQPSILIEIGDLY